MMWDSTPCPCIDYVLTSPSYINISFFFQKKKRKKERMITPFFCSTSQLNSFAISIFAYAVFLLLLKFPICFATDTILPDGSIKDNGNESLVSVGERFKLGFFTPDEVSDSRRYVVIWCTKPNKQEVVWVANRDNPLSAGKTGILNLSKDGQLKLLDGNSNGKEYWSVGVLEAKPSYSNRKVTLMDSGNLILSEKDEVSGFWRVVWQSFDHPTHTFLPGMKMHKNMTLTSWKSSDDLGTGKFTFRQDENHYVIEKSGNVYWNSYVYGDLFKSGNHDDLIRTMSYLLSNFSGQSRTAQYFGLNSTSNTINFRQLLKPSDYNNTRLVMNHDGHIQLFRWNDKTTSWSQLLSEPSDGCNVFKVCGDFSICNVQNRRPCKCLPGYKPNSELESSDGCVRKSEVCNGTDYFLNLTMKVGGGVGINVMNVEDCRKICVDDCSCSAYAYEYSTTRKLNKCWTWSREFINIQENTHDGHEIFVRAAPSDIGNFI